MTCVLQYAFKNTKSIVRINHNKLTISAYYPIPKFDPVSTVWTGHQSLQIIPSLIERWSLIDVLRNTLK